MIQMNADAILTTDSFQTAPRASTENVRAGTPVARMTAPAIRRKRHVRNPASLPAYAPRACAALFSDHHATIRRTSRQMAAKRCP